jgi:cytochrome bd-type quinol oxidase subunit 1
MPDRLPSLVVLVGFWVPPAAIGWVAAGMLRRGSPRARAMLTRAVLPACVLAYAAGWYCFNLQRMPPYIPGATADPTFASPEATAGLAVFTGVLVLPGSALACALAWRRRSRRLGRMPASSASA